jgi:thioredoxin-related protein
MLQYRPNNAEFMNLSRNESDRSEILLKPIFPLLLVAWVGTLTACGALPNKNRQNKPAVGASDGAGSPRGWAMLYPELMNPEGTPMDVSGTLSMAPEGGTPTSAAPGLFDFSSIIPHNGTAMGGLAWHPSATVAIEESRRSGKPLLTLVTHQSSIPAKQMENTLLRQADFRRLATEQLTLLRVDFSNTEARRSDLYQSLKKRLNASGYPTLVLSLPDGTEILHLAGYKPEYHDRYLEKILKAVEKDIPKAVETRQQRLKGEGYRTWQSKDGRDIFARLIKLDANQATFKGEWGNEFSSFTNRLSQQDQDWINQRCR